MSARPAARAPEASTPDEPAGLLVTISATYGAGGSVVAPALAERLGVTLMGRVTSSPDALAEQLRAQESLSPHERGTIPVSRLLASLCHAMPAGPTLSPPSAHRQDDDLRRRVEAEIAHLCALERGVILGRGAAVVLGSERGFHVRLDGPASKRVVQGAAIERIGLDEARARLRAADEARAAYVRHLYRVDPADASLYHLVLDSTAIALPEVVELILSAARSARTPTPTPTPTPE